MFCYVLIENFLDGCIARRNIVSVTLNQQEAYNWVTTVPEFYPDQIVREVQQKPFTGA